MTSSINASAPTADTAVLQDTIVQLNGLVSAYSQILAQAKQQLESLDITEAQILAISDRIADRVNYQRVSMNLIDQINYPDCSGNMDSLLSLIAERVSSRLATDVMSNCNQEIERQLYEVRSAARETVAKTVDERLDASLDQKIDNRMNSYVDAKSSIKALIQLAYGPSALELIAESAADKLRADQATAS